MDGNKHTEGPPAPLAVEEMNVKPHETATGQLLQGKQTNPDNTESCTAPGILGTARE